MKVGYARVSTQEQNEALQLDALRAAHCEKLFSDTISGAKFERKGLDEALTFLRPGDTLVVWKLDRAGRSLTGQKFFCSLYGSSSLSVNRFAHT